MHRYIYTYIDAYIIHHKYRDKRLQCLFMGASTLAAVFPMLSILNTDFYPLNDKTKGGMEGIYICVHIYICIYICIYIYIYVYT
jgi:hypothetical protein